MKDFIGAIVCILIAVFVFAASEVFALKGPNAVSLSRNPALYPRILAAIFCILAIVLMIKAIRDDALKNIKITVDKQKLKEVSRLVFIVLFYIITINYFGYLISSIVFTFILLLVYGGTMKQAMVLSIPITVSLYVVFQVIFNVPLPIGELIELWR